MIIIGFPGIGKSTVSKTNDKYIDLESSCFDKDANKLWYKDYCKTAIDLSNQGYVVFVSSHDKVRDYFISNKVERVYSIFPHIILKMSGLNDSLTDIMIRERLRMTEPSSTL